MDDINSADFKPTTDEVFDRIAHRYDRLCDLFSLGIHRLWKRRVATIIAAQQWEKLLDTATGTGDIIIRVMRQCKTSERRQILASDISSPMLQIARARLPSSVSCEVKLNEINSENLIGISSSSIDCYSMSLALKICNRKAAMQEAYRVLKPGGFAIFLEASNIPIRGLNKAYLIYMQLCMPLIGWIATGGDKSAYKYLLNGIKEFPTAEELKTELKGIGFQDVEFERLSLGIVAIHKAKKPENA